MLIDWIDKLVHPIEEYFNVLLHLLIAHQVLKVTVGVVAIFYFVELIRKLILLSLGLRLLTRHLGQLLRRLRLGFTHCELVVNDRFLSCLIVKHEHSVKT